MTSYFFGIAIGQLLYGPFIDKYGRKKPLLYALVLYMVASIGCSLAYSIDAMVVLRFFQALGGSAGMVCATAIITDIYEPGKRASAFSMIMMVMGIAPIIAPIAGIYFIEHFTWHAIFYFMAVFSIFLIILIFFTLPETAKYMHNEKLKVKRVFSDYFKVFKNRVFFHYTMVGSISGAMVFSYVASASFIFLTYYGVSKTTFSILFGLNAVGMIIGNYINGLITRRFSYIKILRLASAVLIFQTAIFTLLILINPKIAYQWVVLGIFLSQVITGMIYPNAIAASLTPFTALSGSASAINGAARMAFSAFVTGLIGILVSNSAFTMFAVMFALSIVSFGFLLKTWRLKFTQEA